MNFLIIFTDDMRYDELFYMPNVMKLMRGKGTHFNNCRVNTPVCTPSRAGVLTGQYSRDHGILSNASNPTTTQHDESTFVALENAGYRNGAIGKYFTSLIGQSVKPGFDFWRALQNVSPYGIYDSEEYGIYDGTSTFQPTDYQEHYLASQAIDFIRNPDTSPWCLWYCPTTPHWPWQSPPNHTEEFNGRSWPIDIEASVSDKPSWIQALLAVSDDVQAEIRREQRFRLRELLATDDAVGAMVNVLEATGKMDDTTVIFTSDNGMFLGEHRIVGPNAPDYVTYKNVLYDAGLRVPMIVRGPDFPHTIIDVPVNHQDMVATMLALGGATAILPDQLGQRLDLIAATPGSYSTREIYHWRSDVQDENFFPSAHGLTTSQYTFIWNFDETGTDEFELYDRIADPSMHTNRAHDGGAWLTLRNTLESNLQGFVSA